MSGGRRGFAIAVGLLFLLVPLGVLSCIARRPVSKWPPGSDEDQLARTMAAYDHARRWDGFTDALQIVGVDLEGPYANRDIGRAAQEIAERKGAASIPVLIGVIEADNSYRTIYSIGYNVLRPLTKVEYSQFHDGAWWRRWWEAHKHEFPAEVQAIAIPNFDKTDNGQNYVPFPANTDTLQGKLRQLPAALAEDRKTRHGTLDQPRFYLPLLADEIAWHKDLRAVPYLIAFLEASPASSDYVRRALRQLTHEDDQRLVEVTPGQGAWRDPNTGKSYADQFTPDWWRQWWADHRQDYPAAQAIDIPDLSKPLVIDWQEDAAAPPVVTP